MPVTTIDKDPDGLSLTITADFAAPVERIWQIYADPRQLEKIWGPPTHPATFVEHDLTPGGRVTYFMTGPDGEKYPGYWRIRSVERAKSLTFEDGFADADFNPVPDMPVSVNVYSFAEQAGGTRVTYRTIYATAEALQQVLDMGMEEGIKLAIGQIDDLVAA